MSAVQGSFMQPVCFSADVDTRRRAACDLVQALCKSFEGPVIHNFSTYIQGLLGVFKASFCCFVFVVVVFMHLHGRVFLSRVLAVVSKDCSVSDCLQ